MIDELIEECLQQDNSGEGISDFAGDTEAFDCLRSIIGEADCDNLWKRSNNAEVQVAETKKLFPTQVATMFTTKYESSKGGRGQEKAEVNSARKTSVLVDPIVHTRAYQVGNSASEDRKQARVYKKNAESNSNLTRAYSSPVNRSRPQKLKAEIMLVYLVPNLCQVGQSDLKATNDNSSSPPPPMELKPLLSHLKYAYLDIEQQLQSSLPTISTRNRRINCCTS
ncbi:hypothetical protein CR513_56820, partial [Mucuna pruriens]